MIVLRDYQQAIIEEVRQHLRERCKSILVQAPTGAGKTALTASMIGGASAKGRRSWFVVHRRELIRQSATTFKKVGIKYGIVAADSFMDRTQLAQICSVQTLANRLDRLPAPDMIVWDEAHHMAAGTWAKIHSRYPGIIHIGLTATPRRLDGKGLAEYFYRMVRGPSVRWLIDGGYLSDYRAFALPGFDMSGVGKVGGDFNRKQLAAVMDGTPIVGDAVEHYRKHAMGRRGLLFEVTVKRSEAAAERFKAAGIPAAHVDADTPAPERDRAMRDLEAGHLKMVCNVELFGEGVDVPAVEVIHLCRPTASLTLYLQQVGRGLRPAEGKDHCLIFDHAGNIERHGAPEIERDWQLEFTSQAESQGEKDNAPATRQCLDCYCINSAERTHCRFCGSLLPRREARKLVEVDAELQEMDVSALRHQAKREQARAADLAALTALGAMRGYRNPEAWARYVIEGRNKRSQRGAA